MGEHDPVGYCDLHIVRAHVWADVYICRTKERGIYVYPMHSMQTTFYCVLRMDLLPTLVLELPTEAI